MNNMDSEDRFASIYREVRLEEADFILSQCKQDFVPSARYRKRVRRLLANCKKGRDINYVMPIKKRVTLLLVAALILALAGCAWVNRKAIGNFGQTIFSNYLNLSIETSEVTENIYPEIIEEEYYLSYIPDGYEQVEYNSNIRRVMYRWEKENEYISFIQYTLDSLNTYLNTDDADIEIIQYSGSDVYICNQTETINIVWTNQKYGFCIKTNDKNILNDIESMLNILKKAD